jgi:SH3-like domain-containing protein
MFGPVGPLLPVSRFLRAALSLVLAALMLATGPLAAFAAAENPSGLPVPRWVTTRSNPINVRLGPGTKYGIAWVYLKSGMPVEIIQEFDIWRKIRDVDGSEGWLQQNLLQGKRAAIVKPADGANVALYSSADENSGVRAWLVPKFRVDLRECDGTWCRATATVRPTSGGAHNYDGFVRQDALWGVYTGETFD